MPASADPRPIPPYEALAAGYDVVMAHVDYDHWADYVLDLLDRHCPEPGSVLELGCGTGSLALALLERLPEGTCYLATDRSAPMIRVARAKAGRRPALRVPSENLRFEVADFTDFTVEEPVEVVLLLYDGLNYLLEPDPIERLLARVYAALVPGGVFVVDQSTPVNSLNNARFFQDEGEVDDFAYVRRSHYDPDERIHTTAFELRVEGETYAERHVQRAYERDEVERLIAASPLEVAAAYDDFTLRPATPRTERIHWVLRAPSDVPSDVPSGAPSDGGRP